MTEAIIVAGFSLLGTLAGAYFSNKKSTALISYRLEQLEKKVDKHNQVVERTYKLEEQGKKLVKVARFYPSSKRCCRCGKVKKELKLSERIYICECGNVMDRDKNAAVNIREEARRMLTA